MTSQQAKPLNSSNNPAYPSQINLIGASTTLTGPLQIPLTGGTLLSGQTVNLPLQIPGSSGSIQSGNTLNVQIPSQGSNVQLSGGLSGNVPFHLSGMGQQGLHGSLIQLHRSQPTSRIGQQPLASIEKSTPMVQSNSMGIGTTTMQLQDHLNGSPLLKVQGVPGTQLTNNLTGSQVPMQLTHLNSPGSSSHIPITAATTTSQVRNNNRPSPQVLYVQKPIENTNTTGTPHIIVKRSFIPSANSKMAVTTKVATVTKSSLLTSTSTISSHPLVLQKPVKISPNMVPVSISSVPGGKHLYAPNYVNSQKKSGSVTKSCDGQSVLLPVPQMSATASTSKRFLTPMPKAQSTKYVFPGTSKGPMINFQIANGQIQNDPQGKVTVMRDVNNLSNSVSDVPPLQPFSKMAANQGECISTSSVLTPALDKGYTTSIPGSRAEPIGEKEYTLSIPETNSLSEDVYTVSISDETDIDSSLEQSFTISIPEKGKTLLNKPLVADSFQDCQMSAVPAILRRSNSDSMDKKNNSVNLKRRVSACTESADEKNCKSDATKIPGFTSILKSEDITKDKNIPSLFCDEKLEIDLDAKAAAEENACSDSILKNNGITNAPSRHIQMNKDRRKSRVSGDILHHGSTDKKILDDKFTSKKDVSIIDLISDEDTLGLQWKNKVALLNGSSLQFQTNEFGIIDIVTNDDIKLSLDNSSKYDTPLHQRLDRNGREKKPMSPEDLYCCDTCGCHGMAAEFVTPNFCSHTCQANFKKIPLRKDKDSLDFKKKRKQKKILMIKNQKSAFENLSEDQEILNSEPKVFETSSNDAASKLMLEDISRKSMEEMEALGSKYPWTCPINGFGWLKYLEHCKAKPATSKHFKVNNVTIKNGFKVGMKLEAIDPVHPAFYAAVTISEIQGIRLKLHFDGYHEDYDFWVNCDSFDIFPPGWCEKNGRVLRPPMGFTQGSFSWPLYLKQVRAIAAPRALFPHVSTVNICPNGFRMGMKLEAEDRKNSLTCVATAVDVMDSRILIHFDSWDDIYDYWVDPTSPYIHPVGWCDENGVSLTPPNFYKDPEHFTWDAYLKETNSTAVPARAFKPRPPHSFKAGMKLEAVDKRVPFLVRVATITDVRDHQLRISFDGWSDELSYWVDDDNPDIHPVDWCRKTGHALEPPLTVEEINSPGECGTGGCVGLGNTRGAKHRTHSMTSECPYRLPPESPVLRDRLAGVRPPPMHTEPRPKEPRKLIPVPRGRQSKPDSQSESATSSEMKDKSGTRRRLSKSKKPETEIKTEVLTFDEDSNCSQAKRSRLVSPVNQEKVESSVLEPDFHPAPSWIASPNWEIHCIPVEQILQRQTLRVDPRNWSQSDVQDFVEKVSLCKDLSWRFSKHRIDGESFLMLSQEDLVSILGMRLGPAIKVYNSIIQLRRKVLS